jgi:hypothetical protein
MEYIDILQCSPLPTVQKALSAQGIKYGSSDIWNDGYINLKINNIHRLSTTIIY